MSSELLWVVRMDEFIFMDGVVLILLFFKYFWYKLYFDRVDFDYLRNFCEISSENFVI